MSLTAVLLTIAVALQGASTGPVQVDVSGVSGDLRRNIRAHLSLIERQGEGELRESTVRALHQRAPDEIRQALRPFGYYTPTIEGDLVEEGAGWRARYRVDPGPSVRYASVEVTITGQGADDAGLRGILAQLGVAEGEVLRHPSWERAKQALLNEAASRGYLDVEVTRARVEVDTTALSARATLEVNTGPRYRFGEVRFPSTPFVDGFMDRYATFHPGEYFDLDALLGMQRSLTSSPYFRLAQIEPRRSEADSLRVPVDVSLELSRRNSYTIGAGYGTDTGVRGTVSGQRRWLNPYGHRLHAEARASQRAQSFSGQYIVPLGSGPSDRLAATTSAQRDAFGGLESRRILARLELDYALGRWRQVASARLVEEWYQDSTEVRTTTLLIPEIVWSRTWGAGPLYPRDGYQVKLAVSGANEAVISDVSFAQTILDLGAARGLYPGARLLARINAGTTWTDELSALPVSLRLFAGGDQSVRGFGYRSLGPVGDDGTVTGGLHRVVGSIELEQMVIGPVGFALFMDAGNAFATRRAVSPDALERGMGFGVRWRSPIGLVRADVAWPVSQPGRAPRFHFVVGGVL